MRTQAIQGNNYNPQFGMAVHLKKHEASPLYNMVKGFVQEINSDPATKGLHATLEVTNTSIFASGTKLEGKKGAWWGWLLGKYKDVSVPSTITGNSNKGEGTTTKEAIVSTLRAQA